MSFSTDDCKQAVARLSPRQRQCLVLIAQGKARKAMAAELGVKQKTINVHVENVYSRLGVHSATEASRVAHSARLIEVD